MAEPLSTYLSDHLAGATFAVELLTHMRDSQVEAALGKFAANLLIEVEEDRAVLQLLYDQLGNGRNTVKEASSWFAEKTARLKLKLGSDARIGELEALETLCLGVWGKLKLWTALSQIIHVSPELHQLGLDELAKRARTQHDDLESHRLELAKTALIPR